MPTHVTESTGASITAEWEFTTGTCTVSPTASFTADVIGETTAATGVTIDGVRCKDGGVSTTANSDLNGVSTNTISEHSSGAGVTIDGVRCRDGGVSTTIISSFAGVSISNTFDLLGDKVTLAEGGTNQDTYTTNGVIYAGASAFGSTSAGTSGYSLRADSTGVPKFVETKEHIVFVITAPSTNVSASSDAAQFFFPFGGYVETAFAGVSTASTGTSITTIDVRISTTSIFTTYLTIDATETKSSTAAIPAVINAGASTFSTWDLCRVDVNKAGTTPATGLVVELVCVRTT